MSPGIEQPSPTARMDAPEREGDGGTPSASPHAPGASKASPDAQPDTFPLTMHPKGRKRRRPDESNADIRSATVQAAAKQREQFGYQMPKEASRLGRLYARHLREPQPRGPKQAGSVSESIRMLYSKELSDVPESKRWPFIYSKVIPNWKTLKPDDRKAQQDLLRSRVKACLRKRRQRAKAKEKTAIKTSRDNQVS